MSQASGLLAEDNAGISRWLRPSALVLLIANLSPLYGVLILGWNVFPVIFLFWLENLIIGGLNIFRMLFADPGNRTFWFVKIFLIPFFAIHFGLFTFVHGVFVMGLFGGMFRSGATFPGTDTVMMYVHQYELGWPLLGLATSHGISFVVNYLGKGEYIKANPMTLMQQPYGRVVVLHITILAGGFLVMILQSPTAGLLLLIVLKTGLDLRFHLREHRAKGSADTTPSD